MGQYGAGTEEIIDFHVLLRIVAAMLVADEEHRGRNSRSGECSGIMRGWTPQRHAANAQTLGRFRHRHRDGRIDDTDGRCRPFAEFESDIPLGFDPPDHSMYLGLDLDKQRRIVGSHIEAEMKFPWDGRHAVHIGIGVEAPKGNCKRRSRCIQVRPRAVQLIGKGSRRHRRVTPKTAGRPDMVVPADDAGIGMAEIAGNACADRQRIASLEQARRLFDMDLDESTDRGRIEFPFASSQSLRISAAGGDMLRQCAARIDAFRIERTLRQSAQSRTAAYVRALRN